MANDILMSKRTIEPPDQDSASNPTNTPSIHQQYAGKNFWKVISDQIESRENHFEIVNEVFSDIIARLFIEISNWLSVSLIVELINKYEDQFSFRSIQQSFA